MNKWQQKYVDEYYGGKKPRDKTGKLEFDLLSQVKEKVTVHFPDFKGVGGKFEPAHTETYTVTEDKNDMPNGLISACLLASNLALWASRGYKIELT